MSFFDDVAHAPDAPAHPGRRMWLVLGMLVLIGAAAYVALHGVAQGRVPLGTTVDGVPIGGLSRADAAARLSSRLGPDLSQPVRLVYAEQTYRFDAAKAGMSLDTDATLQAAGADASRWSPGSLWSYYTGGRANDARVQVDAQRFSGALARLTARIGRPAVEGTVEFTNGRAVAVYGQTGLAVNNDVATRLVARLVFEHHAGQLPLTVRHPYITPAAVRTALHDFAQPAMSGNVDLVIGGLHVSAPPRLFGEAISMVPQAGRLMPLVNGPQLIKALAPVMRTIGAKPSNATVTVRGGHPVVVPAVYGASYDVQALASALPAVLVKPVGHRVLNLHAAIIKPARTTAQARALGIRTLIGSYTVTGGTTLATSLDGALLTPGKNLALASRLGARSRPLATALFIAALRAGLPIPAYTPASAYDATLPVGLQMDDVTIAAPADHGVLVTTTPLGTKEVTVSLWSTRVAQVRVKVGPQTAPVAASTTSSSDPTCLPRAPVAGFTVTVHRRSTPRTGGAATRDTFVSTYPPVPGIDCVPPSQSPDPSASPSR